MTNLPDVDPIVIAMRSEPFDPHNSFLEINGDYHFGRKPFNRH